MNYDRTRNSKRNIIWGVLYRIVLLVCPFVLRTVMIYIMGVEYAGLGNLFNSIIQVLSLSELGIGSALVYYMYKPISEKNVNVVNVLLNYYKKSYYCIGVFILIAAVVVTPALVYLISGGYPSDINIYSLYFIYIVNTCAGYFFGGYKRSILYASQHTDIESRICAVFTIIQYILQISILFVTKNYYIYIVVLPLMTIASNLTLGYIVDKKYPMYHAKGKIDKGTLQEIKKKVGGIVLQKVGTVVLTSVDNIVVSAFLGLGILAIYNNYVFVLTALISILNVMLLSIIPSIGNSIVTEKKEKNLKDFQKFNFMYVVIISWCVTCLFSLYQPFMKLWMGSKLGSEALLETSMIILLCFYFYFLKLGDIVHAYNEACGLWEKRKFINISAAMLNLVVNIFLVKYIGLYGILLSTIISVVLITIPADAYVLFKYYFGDMELFRRFIANQWQYLLIAIVVTGVVYRICSFELNGDWVNFLVKSILACILTTVFYILIYIKKPLFKESYDFVKNKVIWRR